MTTPPIQPVEGVLRAWLRRLRAVDRRRPWLALVLWALMGALIGAGIAELWIYVRGFALYLYC